jgi:hypothetical protein
MQSDVQGVSLVVGALGHGKDRKESEGTDREHGGVYAARVDCALAESAGGAVASSADGPSHGPEIVIEAMSDDEVAEAARQILTLYDGIMDAARSGSLPK